MDNHFINHSLCRLPFTHTSRIPAEKYKEQSPTSLQDPSPSFQSHNLI